MRVMAYIDGSGALGALTPLAELGHDVHAVLTREGDGGLYEDAGVTVWPAGLWWRAWESVRPDVVVARSGDRRAQQNLTRLARVPRIVLTGAETFPDEEALLAALPLGQREQARAFTPPDPLAGHAIRIAAWVHYGVPHKLAGSEVMLHHLMRALKGAGHGIAVVCSEMPGAPRTWEADGVPYLNLGMHAARRFMKDTGAQVVVTHHHLSPHVMREAKAAGAATVLVQHNDHKGQAHFLASEPDLVVYNTQWVRDSLAEHWPGAGRLTGMVVRPPVDEAVHRIRPRGRDVTLVNLSRNKGVETWKAVARSLPELPFLGVIGAHGAQEYADAPPNISVMAPSADMRKDVWARTRVLLVPSVYESYGLVAAEALASGIPIIAHPTPGLREALGEAATFIDRSDTAAWAEAVRTLHPGGRARSAMASAARRRSAFLAERTAGELGEWVQAVTALARSRATR